MQDSEIIEGNKLIFLSEFVITDWDKNKNGTNVFYLQTLRYHDKIECLWPVISRIRAKVAGDPKYWVLWMPIAQELYMVNEDISGLWSAVVKFLNGAAPLCSNTNNE